MYTYTNYLSILDKTWKFATPGSSAPYHTSLLICGGVNGSERYFVSFEDGLETGCGRYDVG